MSSIIDSEFGDISVRKHAGSRQISISLSLKGGLIVVTPPRTPDFAIKALISTSRPKIRKLLEERQPGTVYTTDSPIGKEHHLIISRRGNLISARTTGRQIIATIPETIDIKSHKIQQLIKQEVAKSLRKEAKKYLPKRIDILAKQFGLEFDRLRFTHASSRWGSCSSSRTISLNIALMNLPMEIIDYVLIHELSHTIHMNHSTEFWRFVYSMDNHYQSHRRALKEHTPDI